MAAEQSGPEPGGRLRPGAAVRSRRPPRARRAGGAHAALGGCATPVATLPPAPAQVTLVLTDNDYTRGMWPHAFKVAYSVALHGASLVPACGLGARRAAVQ